MGEGMCVSVYCYYNLTTDGGKPLGSGYDRFTPGESVPGIH